MPDKEQFRELLHTNPEIFPGVPSNEEIMQANKLERLPTDAERQGFLEMWRYEYVKEVIGQLSPGDLEQLIVDARERTEQLRQYQREAAELDWILWTARSSKLARNYMKGK